jgi:hypothetical protein
MPSSPAHTSKCQLSTLAKEEKTFAEQFFFLLRFDFSSFASLFELFYSPGRDTNFLLISVEFNFFYFFLALPGSEVFAGWIRRIYTWIMFPVSLHILVRSRAEEKSF